MLLNHLKWSLSFSHAAARLGTKDSSKELFP